MKLIDDFFEVQENSITEGGFVTTTKLNPFHVIYAGHFPGYPVTPGVVQMQIVHELLEKHFGRKLKLVTMPKCTFVKVLNPTETATIDVHVEFNLKDELLHVKAWGVKGTDTFFKLNATYKFSR